MFSYSVRAAAFWVVVVELEARVFLEHVPVAFGLEFVDDVVGGGGDDERGFEDSTVPCWSSRFLSILETILKSPLWTMQEPTKPRSISFLPS